MRNVLVQDEMMLHIKKKKGKEARVKEAIKYRELYMKM